MKLCIQAVALIEDPVTIAVADDVVLVDIRIITGFAIDTPGP